MPGKGFIHNADPGPHSPGWEQVLQDENPNRGKNGVGLQREALDNGRGDEKEREDERR